LDSAGIADVFESAVVVDPGGAVTDSGADFVSLAGFVSGGAVTIFLGSISAAVSVAGLESAAGTVTGGAATLSVAGFVSVVGGVSVLATDSFAIVCFAFGLTGGGAETGAGPGSAFDPEAGLPTAFVSSVGTDAGASFETAGFASTAAGSTDFSLGMTGLDSAGDVDAVVDVSGGG